MSSTFCKNRRFMPRCLLLAACLGFAWAGPAQAQSSPRLSLFALDASSFPGITLGMDVWDASGNLVTGITADQVTLYEDDLPVPLTSLVEVQPGVQFAVALDAGAGFAFRGPSTVSRLEIITGVLRQWSLEHEDAFFDDLTLVGNGGDIYSHLNADGFGEALAAYQPDLQTLDSSLTTLSRALDLVSETGSQVGMKRVVLFISSPTPADSIPALLNLTQRALDQQVRVHAWIVASSDIFNTSGATALKDLSIRTGGAYALFSGSESLPDPEVYLTPLRHSYTLAYDSSIRSTGTHTLHAQVDHAGGTLTSDSLTLPFTIEPPNPILVSPPGQIVRQGLDSHSMDFTSFQPAVQEIEAIIEFTDGLQRPLTRTALYVDEVLVDENISEPFDRFTWDLSGYTRSGDHVLQLQAADSLGLEKNSLGWTVTVTVVQPEKGISAFMARNERWIILGVVGLAGVALVGMLISGYRLRRKSLAEKKKPEASSNPLAGGQATHTGQTLKNRASGAIKPAGAWLVRLQADGQPMSSPPIPLTASEIMFGSDPLHATRVLDDLSVSPLHARLWLEDGRYTLSDEGSVAGTWVNYQQLSAPRQLRHGDVFQVGRVAYLFQERLALDSSHPRVTLLKK